MRQTGTVKFYNSQKGYGGDEFVAIVFGLDDNAASIRFGQRLIEAIERPFHSVLTTCASRRASVSCAVAQDLNAADILRRADIAAYSA